MRYGNIGQYGIRNTTTGNCAAVRCGGTGLSYVCTYVGTLYLCTHSTTQHYTVLISSLHLKRHLVHFLIRSHALFLSSSRCRI